MCFSSHVSGGDIATPLEQRRGRARPPRGRPARPGRPRPASAASASARELDRGQEAEPGADLAHRGVVGQRRQRVAQRALELPPARRSGPRARRCRARPARPRSSSGGRRRWRRGAASAPPASAKNGAATCAGDDHAAEREVAGGHALGERDHVGPDVLPALDPEPRAEPAEGADHRVDDEQDRRARRTGRRRPGCSPRAAASTPPAPITGSQKNAATRVRADAQRSPPPAPPASRREPWRRAADQRAPVGRRWPRSRRSRCRSRACRGSPACGGSCARARAGPGRMKCRRAILAAVSIASPPPRAEEDPRVVHRRELGQPGAQLVRRAVPEVAERRVRLEAAHLRRDGVGDLRRGRGRCSRTRATPWRRGSGCPRCRTPRRPRRARSTSSCGRRRPCRRTGARTRSSWWPCVDG